eukprot:Skav219577  [mRNA]  locus=scaffold249:126418:127095:+ [translate_table: standard]
MSSSLTRLTSCIGYAVRLSRKSGVPKDVSDHLQQALHHVKQYNSDISQPDLVELIAKRGRTINLSDCLQLPPVVSHSECQTDGRLIDEDMVAGLIKEMGEKNHAMMQRHVQTYLDDVSLTLASQAKQHAEMKRAMDARAAHLQAGLDTLLSTLRDGESQIAQLDIVLQSIQPLSPGTRWAVPPEVGPSERAPFLTRTDVAMLSQASSFHFHSCQGIPSAVCLDNG